MDNYRVKLSVRSDKYGRAVLLYRLSSTLMIGSGVVCLVSNLLKLNFIATVAALLLVASAVGIIVFGKLRYKNIEIRYIMNDDTIKLIDNKEVETADEIKYENTTINMGSRKYIVFDEEDEAGIVKFIDEVRNIRGYTPVDEETDTLDMGNLNIDEINNDKVEDTENFSDELFKEEEINL